MLRHVLMFRLKPDTSADSRALLVEQLHVMHDRIPQLLTMSCGQDAGVADRGFDNPDVIASMDFADERSWREYLAHPDHEYFTEQFLLPILNTTTGVQFFHNATPHSAAL